MNKSNRLVAHMAFPGGPTFCGLLYEEGSELVAYDPSVSADLHPGWCAHCAREMFALSEAAIMQYAAVDKMALVADLQQYAWGHMGKTDDEILRAEGYLSYWLMITPASNEAEWILRAVVQDAIEAVHGTLHGLWNSKPYLCADQYESHAGGASC